MESKDYSQHVLGIQSSPYVRITPIFAIDTILWQFPKSKRIVQEDIQKLFKLYLTFDETNLYRLFIQFYLQSATYVVFFKRFFYEQSEFIQGDREIFNSAALKIGSKEPPSDASVELKDKYQKAVKLFRKTQEDFEAFEQFFIQFKQLFERFYEGFQIFDDHIKDELKQHHEIILKKIQSIQSKANVELESERASLVEAFESILKKDASDYSDVYLICADRIVSRLIEILYFYERLEAFSNALVESEKKIFSKTTLNFINDFHKQFEKKVSSMVSILNGLHEHLVQYELTYADLIKKYEMIGNYQFEGIL